MSDTTNTTTDDAAAASAPAASAAQPAGDPIDWKAEARKWEQRAKDNKAAADELANIKAAREADRLTFEQQLAEIRKDAEKAAAEATRFRVAAAKGVPAELLPESGDEEALTAFADKVLAFRSEGQPDRHVVPGVGNTPPKPPTAQERIRAAEASGNVAASMAEKAGLLAALASGQTS